MFHIFQNSIDCKSNFLPKKILWESNKGSLGTWSAIPYSSLKRVYSFALKSLMWKKQNSQHWIYLVTGSRILKTQCPTRLSRLWVYFCMLWQGPLLISFLFKNHRDLDWLLFRSHRNLGWLFVWKSQNLDCIVIQHPYLWCLRNCPKSSTNME